METDNISSNSWERKTKLLFTEESLLDLKWHKPLEETRDKICTPVQLVRVGTKLNSSKLPPGNFLDLHDTGMLSESDDTGLHIESSRQRP